jgi:hypothetical protein
VTGKKLLIKNLEADQVFHLEVLADYDLDNEKPAVKDQKIGEIDFTSEPIESLGFLYLSVDFENITSNGLVAGIKANTNKTDALLLQLINEVKISFFDKTKFCHD